MFLHVRFFLCQNKVIFSLYFPRNLLKYSHVIRLHWYWHFIMLISIFTLIIQVNYTSILCGYTSLFIIEYFTIDLDNVILMSILYLISVKNSINYFIYFNYMLDHMIVLNFFWRTFILYSITAVQFTFLTKSIQSFPSFHIFISTCYLMFFLISIITGMRLYLIVSFHIVFS